MVRFSERTTQTTADKENESKDLSLFNLSVFEQNVFYTKPKGSKSSRKKEKKSFTLVNLDMISCDRLNICNGFEVFGHTAR